MASPRVLRLSGIALIIAGIIQAAATIVDPDLTTTPNAIYSPFWVPSHMGFSIAYTLVLLGLAGLYFCQAERLTWLSEAGFIAALFGSALTVSISMVVGVALPLIAPQTPSLIRSLPFLQPGGPLQSMLPVLVLTVLTYFPGFVMTGLATMRAGVMPRQAAFLLIIGSLGNLGSLPGPGLVARLITISGSLLLGTAFVWLGYELFTDRRTRKA